jgi:diguanylate cyclase (GGDEF)-like protein
MKLKLKIWLSLGLLVSVVLILDLSFSYRKLVSELQAEARYDARTVFGFMMATRRIYQQQFVASGLPVDDRTIGFLPAHSFSRISKDFANWNKSGIFFNNVTDTPRNPGNLADRFEQEDMAYFRTNPKQTERMKPIVDDQGRRFMLYTAPIWIEPFCLKCHGDREAAPASIRDRYPAAYGYKVGDLRGLVSIRIPTRHFDDRLREVWGWQAVKSLLGYLVLFVVLGLLLERLVIRRLARLREGAQQVAAGEYDIRVAGGEGDEIAELAGGFNRMAEEVQARESALQREVEEKERGLEEIHRLAYFDTLTGLPNRAMLLDRLGMVLAIAIRQARTDALLLLNIDRFKNINEARGHKVGDLLLVKLAERLRPLLRDGDTLARLSGDEFAILLPGVAASREQAGRRILTVAAKIHDALREPFEIEDQGSVVLTASLGVSLCPEGDADQPGDVMRRADMALHRVKAAGGNDTAFFEVDMGESAQRRFVIERELRQAIRNDELRLYLQPQVNASGKLVGAEALVRWQHPERGLIPPGMFIPIAEESDLIIELGNWVFAEACRICSRDCVHGDPIRLSVNLSPRQFRQKGFVSWLKDLLASTGADPTRLTIEVTESLVIGDFNEVVARMHELTALGIHFSVDDFGTGYSSLAYLKRLPIHELKIDKMFVQDAPSDADDAALVETILAVARHLRLRVVAEGVETQEQADFMNARASVIHQGYLYGRPEPAEVWIERWCEIGSRQQP